MYAIWARGSWLVNAAELVFFEDFEPFEIVLYSDG